MKRIIVCVKPVPDPKHWGKVSMDPATMTLKREGIPSIINPLDRHALEAALSFREQQGGEVVLLSLAPPSATSILRQGLAMGADRAVLITDPSFAGSDTLATARILAAGCRWVGGSDLILCGNLSIDGSTAQVSAQLAEFLDLPSVMHVVGLEWMGQEELVVTRRIECGFEKLLAKPPLVLAVRKEINKPRYIAFAGILAAESKEIQQLGAPELDLTPDMIGLRGSPTKMAGLELKRFKRAGERIEGSADEIAARLADKLYEYGVI